MLTLVLLQVDEKQAFTTYCAVSFLSEIPFIVAVVSLGNSIDQLEQGKSNGVSEILLVVQIILTLAVIGIMVYIGKKSYRQIKHKSDNLVDPEIKTIVGDNNNQDADEQKANSNPV